MTGEVKWFDVTKHYGFIVPDGVSIRDRDAHVFVHESVLEEPLTAGQQVEYSLHPGTSSPKALWVKLLNKRSYVPINQQQQRKAAYGD